MKVINDDDDFDDDDELFLRCSCVLLKDFALILISYSQLLIPK